MNVAKWAVRALERVPKNAVSRAFGVVSEVEFPAPLQKAVNHSFAALAQIDVEEAEARPEDYETLNAFFTRRLKEGARQVEAVDEKTLVSPVDGRLGAFGAIEEGTLLQAKGREYRVVDLLDSAEEAARFQGGKYATVYLSPTNYHRIHAPASGVVDKISYIPGHLFPVNAFAVRHIDELFAVNERLISYLETENLGRVAVVKVGATCVGRIQLTYDEVVTNRRFRRREEFAPRKPHQFEPGEEMAVFNLGSTVIVLAESSELSFRKDLKFETIVKMGERLTE